MKITTQIRLLGPATAILTTAFVGLAVYWGFLHVVEEQQFERLAARAQSEGALLGVSIEQLRSDARFLVGLPSLRQVANNGTDNNDDANLSPAASAAETFEAMLRTRPHYDQIRLIGRADDGREIIRLDRRNEDIVTVTGSDLQQKGDRDYFRETLALGQDEIYVSEITLNREFGQLEIPHRPMLRAAMPLWTNGQAFGIVVINLNFERMATSVLADDEGPVSYYATNSTGDYVVHPDPAKTFGFDLGQRYTIQEEFPDLASLLGAETGIDETVRTTAPDGKLVQARKLFPFPESDRFMTIAVAALPELIDVPPIAIGARVLAVAALVVLLATLTTYSIASSTARPLRRLTEDAAAIARGDAVTLGATARTDEIGVLHDALRRMVDALRENAESLRQANRDLEDFTRIASHELTEPARRVAALSNLLESDLGSDQPQFEVVERLHREGLLMIDTLSELRTFIRLSRQSTGREPVDPAALMRDAADLRERQLRSRHLGVSIADMPTVDAYCKLFGLMLGRLLDLAIESAPADTPSIDFYCVAKGPPEQFCLEIRDPGAEIAARDVQTADSRTSLTWAIIRRVCEHHGGRLWIEQDAGFRRYIFTLRAANL